MELLAIIMGMGVVALSVWVWYVFTNLAIAVWMPKKSNKKWLEILDHPMVNYMRPFIKWIVPLCLLIFLSNLVFQGALLILGP